MFHAWGNLLGVWLRRSRHSPRVVRGFGSVKCESVGSMCLYRYGYECASDGMGWIPAFAGMTWVGAGMTWVRGWKAWVKWCGRRELSGWKVWVRGVKVWVKGWKVWIGVGMTWVRGWKAWVSGGMTRVGERE